MNGNELNARLEELTSETSLSTRLDTMPPDGLKLYLTLLPKTVGSGWTLGYDVRSWPTQNTLAYGQRDLAPRRLQTGHQGKDNIGQISSHAMKLTSADGSYIFIMVARINGPSDS